jgi:predicted AlkP superfamily pyrophosphatase or phosphodiesterase
MRRTAVINVVGLTPRLLGEHTPRLSAFAQAAARAAIEPAFPAVTCPAQTAYLTGQPPARHGIVGNGWYDRALAEVHFWKQSNHLVQAPRLWHRLRAEHPDFTCAKLFWWFNMYADVEWSVTPRPMYPADGRKVFDIYAWPYALRPALKRDLGEFPFPAFWGPTAGVDSPVGPPDAASRWIAAAARWIERHHRPTLNLVYLPHLDYNLQRLGPDHPAIAADLRRIDDLAGGLVAFFQERDVRVVVLSEYGLVPVRRPVHLNRVLRRAGWLVVKEELGGERLDAGASGAFAVADHQVAHLYLKRPDLADAVRETVTALPGVARVLDAEEKRARGLDHPRAGDLIAVAEPDAWFTYYYWEDGPRAGFRAHGGHPPQARLRPRGAVRPARLVAPAPESAHRPAAAPETARLPHVDGRHPARRHPRPRLPRRPARRLRRLAPPPYRHPGRSSRRPPPRHRSIRSPAPDGGGINGPPLELARRGGIRHREGVTQSQPQIKTQYS